MYSRLMFGFHSPRSTCYQYWLTLLVIIMSPSHLHVRTVSCYYLLPWIQSCQVFLFSRSCLVHIQPSNTTGLQNLLVIAPMCVPCLCVWVFSAYSHSLHYLKALSARGLPQWNLTDSLSASNELYCEGRERDSFDFPTTNTFLFLLYANLTSY